MREILFRGKRIDTGEWVYGYYYVEESKRHMILPIDGYPTHVDPSTVGQFTGLLDKNGNKIFEGDVVRFLQPNTFPHKEWLGNVEYNKDCAAFGLRGGNTFFDINQPFAEWDEPSVDLLAFVEIIGTIHDKSTNPTPPGAGESKRK